MMRACSRVSALYARACRDLTGRVLVRARVPALRVHMPLQAVTMGAMGGVGVKAFGLACLLFFDRNQTVSCMPAECLGSYFDFGF